MALPTEAFRARLVAVLELSAVSLTARQICDELAEFEVSYNDTYFTLEALLEKGVCKKEVIDGRVHWVHQAPLIASN